MENRIMKSTKATLCFAIEESQKFQFSQHLRRLFIFSGPKCTRQPPWLGASASEWRAIRQCAPDQQTRLMEAPPVGELATWSYPPADVNLVEPAQ